MKALIPWMRARDLSTSSKYHPSHWSVGFQHMNIVEVGRTQTCRPQLDAMDGGVNILPEY